MVRQLQEQSTSSQGLQSSVLGTVYMRLSAKVQGRQQLFTDHVIKFNADEEVCGRQGVAKVPLFTAGQSHQAHGDRTLPIDVIFTTEVLLVVVLLNASFSPWRLFSPALKTSST